MMIGNCFSLKSDSKQKILQVFLIFSAKLKISSWVSMIALCRNKSIQIGFHENTYILIKNHSKPVFIIFDSDFASISSDSFIQENSIRFFFRKNNLLEVCCLMPAINSSAV